jgi:hypothetical protein
MVQDLFSVSDGCVKEKVVEGVLKFKIEKDH